MRRFKVDLGPGSGALRCGAEQVVQDVDDGGDIPFRPAELVLQGGIQRSGEGPGVDALPMVLHGFDHCPGADVAGLLLCGIADLVGEYSLRQFAEGLR